MHSVLLYKNREKQLVYKYNQKHFVSIYNPVETKCSKIFTYIVVVVHSNFVIRKFSKKHLHRLNAKYSQLLTLYIS
jgi:hypothetical protein